MADLWYIIKKLTCENKGDRLRGLLISGVSKAGYLARAVPLRLLVYIYIYIYIYNPDSRLRETGIKNQT